MSRKFYLRLIALLLAATVVEVINIQVITPMLHWPEIVGEGYVRPKFAAEVARLRGTILASTKRHNHPQRSGMSDQEFAELLATILYTEHNGWFEDLVPPVRHLRPAFQWAQDQPNLLGLGTDYSMWPANLRPSVALEILEQRLPVPGPTREVVIAVQVFSSTVASQCYPSQGALYAAVSAELRDPELAIEYLAANLERGIARAHYEDVPVTWQALAAWHNQGIVQPEQIAASDLARSYVLRAAQYRERARSLITQSP